MSRSERINTYRRVVHDLFNSPKFHEICKKQMKIMRKYNMSTSIKSIEHMGIPLTVMFDDGGKAYDAFADIGIRNREYAKYLPGGNVAVYTEHFFQRYNERMNLGLTSIKDVLKAFYFNEAMTHVKPYYKTETEVFFRTRNGFTHGKAIERPDLGYSISYMNTWFDLDEDKPGVKEAKEFDKLNNLSSKQKDKLYWESTRGVGN